MFSAYEWRLRDNPPWRGKRPQAISPEFPKLSKLLLLILAAAVLYLLVKGFGRKASARKPEAHASTEGERMVGCAHCGVNLPQIEALKEGGAYFCGEAHRRLGPR